MRIPTHGHNAGPITPHHARQVRYSKGGVTTTIARRTHLAHARDRDRMKNRDRATTSDRAIVEVQQEVQEDHEANPASPQNPVLVDRADLERIRALAEHTARKSCTLVRVPAPSMQSPVNDRRVMQPRADQSPQSLAKRSVGQAVRNELARVEPTNQTTL